MLSPRSVNVHHLRPPVLSVLQPTVFQFLLSFIWLSILTFNRDPPQFLQPPGLYNSSPPTVSVVLIINFITFMLSAPQVHATRYLFCVSDDISLVRSDKRRGSHRIIAGQFTVSAAPGPGSPYRSRNRRSQPSTRHDVKALFRYHAPVHQSGIRVSSYLSQSLDLSNVTFINCYFISN